MADYNIYIHDLTGGSQVESQTKAWSPSQNSQTKAWESLASTSEKMEGSSPNFMSPLMAMGRGITNAAKSHPVIAAAIVVTTIAIKITDTVVPFVTRETGDYRFSKLYGDIKTHLNNLTKPISFAIGWAQNHQENMIYNKKQEQERALIGESYVNSSTRKV